MDFEISIDSNPLYLIERYNSITNKDIHNNINSQIDFEKALRGLISEEGKEEINSGFFEFDVNWLQIKNDIQENRKKHVFYSPKISFNDFFWYIPNSN
ncbi:hypothetical protein PIROE2DRAFT_8959 [Piromyces sp. E2]|nr:hypothetical protein PIROE2DRAFT_8959 [Piromyces sp. E2]|eukprot:OUM64280.1 hypothetical protein PIROE2DRAFT_8959 [Piromyces sp. E2]